MYSEKTEIVDIVPVVYAAGTDDEAYFFTLSMKSRELYNAAASGAVAYRIEYKDDDGKVCGRVFVDLESTDKEGGAYYFTFRNGLTFVAGGDDEYPEIEATEAVEGTIERGLPISATNAEIAVPSPQSEDDIGKALVVDEDGNLVYGDVSSGLPEYDTSDDVGKVLTVGYDGLYFDDPIHVIVDSYVVESITDGSQLKKQSGFVLIGVSPQLEVTTASDYNDILEKLARGCNPVIKYGSDSYFSILSAGKANSNTAFYVFCLVGTTPTKFMVYDPFAPTA